MPDSIGSTPETSAFAEGWTAFSTAEGLDIILRTSAGESKGRLAALDSQGRLVGSMFEPNDDPAATAASIDLTVEIEANDRLLLTCGSRSWTLRQPAGKAHWFAFWNQWPAKAEPASLKAMLAGLKKKS